MYVHFLGQRAVRRLAQVLKEGRERVRVRAHARERKHDGQQLMGQKVKETRTERQTVAYTHKKAEAEAEAETVRVKGAAERELDKALTVEDHTSTTISTRGRKAGRGG